MAKSYQDRDRRYWRLPLVGWDHCPDRSYLKNALDNGPKLRNEAYHNAPTQNQNKTPDSIRTRLRSSSRTHVARDNRNVGDRSKRFRTSTVWTKSPTNKIILLTIRNRKTLDCSTPLKRFLTHECLAPPVDFLRLGKSQRLSTQTCLSSSSLSRWPLNQLAAMICAWRIRGLMSTVCFLAKQTTGMETETLTLPNRPVGRLARWLLRLEKLSDRASHVRHRADFIMLAMVLVQDSVRSTD